jgi:ribose-phosphate pyrophosphokinase
VDAHFSQFQGFLDIPVDNLYSVYLFADYLADNYLGNNGEHRHNYVLVSPDNGGSKRVEHYAKLLQMEYVVMNKRRDYTKANTVLATELFNSSDSSKLRGKTGIVIDDIIDSGGTIVEACKKLDEYGFNKYILVATHGIFSEPVMERIAQADNITAVIVSDSVCMEHKKLSPKVIVLSLCNLLSKYITQLETEESISVLFRDRPIFEKEALVLCSGI